MMKTAVLATITVIAVVISIGWVLDATAELRWEKSRPLTWDDFQGIPDLRALSLGAAAIKADVKHQSVYDLKIIQGSCH